MGPVPGMLQELGATQIRLFDPLLGQLSHHPCFGGNGGMVGTRHPEGIFSHHTSPADQHILKGIVEHVPHVQHTGNVGWRNDNAIGFPLIGRTFKESVFHPVGIPFILNTGGIVF